MPLDFNYLIAMKFAIQPSDKLNTDITLTRYLIKSQQNCFFKNSGLAYKNSKFLLMGYHITILFLIYIVIIIAIFVQ